MKDRPDIHNELLNETDEYHSWMKEQGEKKVVKRKKALLLVTILFSFLSILIWLNEILDISHLLLGTPRTSYSWIESTLHIIVIFYVGAFVLIILIDCFNHIKQIDEKIYLVNDELNRYLKKLEQHNTKVTVFSQMGEMLQCCQTSKDSYAVIGQYAEKLFPGLKGALFMLNETKDLLDAVCAWNGSKLESEIFTPETCWAVRRGRVHAAEAGSRLHCRHVRDEEEGGEFRPYLCVPLSAQGELLGMLHLSTAPGQTIGEWKQLAMTVAERTALAISNLRMREKLRMDSILDPLTDLFNRRFLDTMLERELLRAARRQRPVSVAMIDLDNLKQVNDVLGHGAGDVLLQELGRFFEASIRKEDFVCRYGGDEFTITFPEMALEDAHKRLEKLRKGVKKLNIQYRDQTLEAVTVSIGVACYPQDGETVATLLKAADQALYRAKEIGRDCIGESKV